MRALNISFGLCSNNVAYIVKKFANIAKLMVENKQHLLLIFSTDTKFIEMRKAFVGNLYKLIYIFKLFRHKSIYI